MLSTRTVKWLMIVVVPLTLLVACASTQQQAKKPPLTDQTLETIHLGLDTPTPAQCRFLNTITVKFDNDWLKGSQTAHQLRENALRELLEKANNHKANYVHVRQISAETMGVFSYDFTSSVLATGDAFDCRHMPKNSQKAMQYLKQHDLTLGS